MLLGIIIFCAVAYALYLIYQSLEDAEQTYWLSRSSGVRLVDEEEIRKKREEEKRKKEQEKEKK